MRCAREDVCPDAICTCESWFATESENNHQIYSYTPSCPCTVVHIQSHIYTVWHKTTSGDKLSSTEISPTSVITTFYSKLDFSLPVINDITMT